MHELLLAAAPTALAAWTGGWAWLRWRLRRRSGVLRVGQRAPRVALPDANGRVHDLANLPAPLVAVLFMSNRCPGVKAYDARLKALQAEFGDRLAVVGINPVDEALYPGEDPRGMAAALAERGLRFLYLKDAGGAVARRFGAACTPHVFLLDAQRRLRYEGRIDDALLEANVRRRHLRRAILDVLAGRRVRVARTLPLGCSIDASAPSALAAPHAVRGAAN